MAFTQSMSDNDTTTRSGRSAEDLAAHFLERHGLRIVARNHRCRGGEIDLVCQDGETLVFVEVRLRQHPGFGGAGASVTRAKQRRIALAAEHYLSAHRRHDDACRFDCVLLSELGADDIEWVRDAFSAH